jgi:hypothetical protein
LKKGPDQRRAQRFAWESPLVCSSVNGHAVYSARTINHCESGLGFVTQTPLEAGMTIYFRADLGLRAGRNAAPNRPLLRGTGLARIRWTRPLGDPAAGRYCVGAEYVDSYP